MAYFDSTSGTTSTATWQRWTSPTYYYDDSRTWPAWTTESIPSTGNDTYQVWASDGATTTATNDITITTDATWSTWVTDTTYVEIAPDVHYEAPTQAELKAERKRRKEAEKKAEEAIAAQEQAEKKAKELLEDLIGEDQLEVYNRTGRLLVHGREYDYLLVKDGCVRRVEKDKIVDLCIHLVDKFKMPDTDNVISLKLLAEANEKGFNELANVIRSEPREELPEAACA